MRKPDGDDRPDIAQLLTEHPVFDGHNDLPFALRERFGGAPERAALASGQPLLHTDIPALRRGGVGAQIWSVYVPSGGPEPEAVVQTLEQIDVVRRLIAAHPDTFQAARTGAEVRAAWRAGRIASMIGAEGGHSIASSLGVLRMLRELGVVSLTLTHNDNTGWAASATGEDVAYGLTADGRQVVREMNRIGMLVDLSHVDARTMADALEATSAPVVFSHSSCRAVTDHPRNVPDDILERLSDNGGVQMLTFVPSFVSDAVHDDAVDAARVRADLALPAAPEPVAPGSRSDAERAFAAWRESHPAPEATVDDVVRHVEHAREVAGAAHIGLGGDFDGVETTTRGLQRVSDYPRLIAALADRGWSERDLGLLTSGNVLRVLDAVAP